MDIFTVMFILFIGFGIGIVVCVMNKQAAIDETYDSGYSDGWEHAMTLQKDRAERE